MADEIVAGAPGGGSEAGSGGGAPSAGSPSAGAPSTGSPSTGAPSTGSGEAPVAVPVAVPETPFVRGPKETEQEALARFRKENPPENKPAVEAPKAAVVDPAKPAIDKPAVDPAKPAVEVPKDVVAEDPLDKLGPLPASELSELLKTKPELDSMLEEAGIKDKLFTALRDAAGATQFRELYADIETAKFAHKAAVTLHQMDEAATALKPGDLATTQDFVQKVLMPMSYVLDDDGNPKMREVKGADGKMYQVPETDGTVQTVVNNIRDFALDQIVADIEVLGKSQNPDHKALAENLQDAVKALQSYIKGSEQDPANMTEEMRQERSRLEAQRSELNTRQAKESEERYQTFVTGVLESTNAALDTVINDWLSGSTLVDAEGDSQSDKDSKAFLRSGVVREIRDNLFAKWNEDPLFKAEQEQIARRGYSQKSRDALVNHYKRSANAILKDVAAPVLQKAGHARVSQANAKAKKIATQVDNSRMEARGTQRPAAPGAAPAVDERQLMSEARINLTKTLRRDPQPDELIREFRTLLAARAVPA